MRLASLAEEISDHLNESPLATWSDLTVGTRVTPEVEDRYVVAAPRLDPSTTFESGKRGLHIIPVMVGYNRTMSKGRQQLVQLDRSQTISICLSIPFTTPDTEGIDVGSWSAVEKVLNLREEIDEYVLSNNWGLQIKDIIAEPAQQIQLKQSWFLSITEIEFGDTSCG